MSQQCQQNVGAVSKRIDANVINASVMLPFERTRINFYAAVMDKLIVEPEESFPTELQAFLFPGPKHFRAIDVET